MKNFRLFVITLMVILASCGTGKYVSDFKTIKKSMDTLEIVPVDIQIKTVDYNKKQLTDELLSIKVQKDIVQKMRNVLGSKYILTLADTTVNYTQLYTDLERMRFFIATQQNPLKNEEAPFSYRDLGKTLKHRYTIILLVRAQYHINSPDRMSSLWTDPQQRIYCNQYLFLIDKTSNKILYFKKSNSDGDISDTITVEKVTLESIQNLYYK